MFKTLSKGIFKTRKQEQSTFAKTIRHAIQRPYDCASTEAIHITETGRHTKRHPRLISIGGGKGGIGKTFLSANICLRLASLGYKVAIVDLDLGAANLHTCLGIPTPKKGICDFLSGKLSSFEDTGTTCYLPNLTLYGGGHEFWQQVNMQNTGKIKLLSGLKELDVDYVFLDLGAGTHVHTLDFFIFSHSGILVVTPEPTSIENSYVFMKSVLYRKVQSTGKMLHFSEKIEKDLLDRISHVSASSTPYAQLVSFARENPHTTDGMIDLIKSTNIGIIMNQVRTHEDCDLGDSMSAICQKYFGFSAQFLGSARYDDAVWKAIRQRKPLILESHLSPVSFNINGIAEQIIKRFSL